MPATQTATTRVRRGTGSGMALSTSTFGASRHCCAWASLSAPCSLYQPLRWHLPSPGGPCLPCLLDLIFPDADSPLLPSVDLVFFASRSHDYCLCYCSLMLGSFDDSSSQSGIPLWVSASAKETPWVPFGHSVQLSCFAGESSGIFCPSLPLVPAQAQDCEYKPNSTHLHRPDGPAHCHREAEHGTSDPPGGEWGRCPGCSQRGLL